MKRVPAFITLTIITLVAAALLALTNEITHESVERAAAALADSARFVVLPAAESFTQESAPDGLDALHTGMAGDVSVGVVATVTTRGFAGPIEAIVGIDETGKITGVSVGGNGFAETAGLGTLVKEPAFTDQFVGQTVPLALGDTIDSVSGATISSRAVVDAVNLAVQNVSIPGMASVPEGSADTQSAATGTKPSASGTSASDQQAGAVAMGYGGPVYAQLSINAQGIISALALSAENETPGLGDKIIEAPFLAQFIGKKPPLSADDIDAIAGATVSTDAALNAINAAYALLQSQNP